MTRVIAISSQKGGIGKTTTTANLAVAWGSMGRRVLAIDLDPQFALTRRFGIAPTQAAATAFELLAGGGRLADGVLFGIAPGVDLVAGRRELARLELSLAGEHHRERFLSELLRGAIEPWDDVVIDCPPSLALLTVNAMVAAGEVVVPVDMTDEGRRSGRTRSLHDPRSTPRYSWRRVGPSHFSHWTRGRCGQPCWRPHSDAAVSPSDAVSERS